MPDNARALAETLLSLAGSQHEAVLAQDWDTFLALAAKRETLQRQLEPLVVAERTDLRPLLERIQTLDAAHVAGLQAASADVLQSLAELRPQQVAMHAYYGGGAGAAPDREASFIDRRD